MRVYSPLLYLIPKMKKLDFLKSFTAYFVTGFCDAECYFLVVISKSNSVKTGLSEELKVAFPNAEPILRPLIQNQVIPDPCWLAGFINGEGFFIHIKASKTKIGKQVLLKFQISQHLRDKELLESFVDYYFGCGNYYFSNSQKVGHFIVSNFSDIDQKIIPYLKRYPIIGIKLLELVNFCEVAELIKTKQHLTDEGFKKIRDIKNGMNRNRDLSKNSSLEEIQYMKSDMTPVILFLTLVPFIGLFLILVPFICLLMKWTMNFLVQYQVSKLSDIISQIIRPLIFFFLKNKGERGHLTLGILNTIRRIKLDMDSTWTASLLLDERLSNANILALIPFDP